MMQQQQYPTSFHGSSASFSSTFSTSRLSGCSSTSSSSSFSSPSASPPFFNSFLLTNSNTDISSPSITNTNPNPHCTIPFLWEEKPGVLKKNQRQEDPDCCIDKQIHRAHQINLTDSSALSAMHSDSRKRELYTSKVAVAKNLDRVRHSYISKTDDDLSDYSFSTDTESYGSRSRYAFHSHNYNTLNIAQPRLRPPPRLQNSSAKPANQKNTGFIRRRRLHGGRSSSVSLDDDPFWLAMVACSTEDFSKFNTNPNTNSSATSSSSSELSTLPKSYNQNQHQNKVVVSHKTLKFEQCMPGRRHHSCENPSTCTSSSSTASTPVNADFAAVSKRRNAATEHIKNKHDKPPLPATSAMARSEYTKHHQNRSHQQRNQEQQNIFSAGNNSTNNNQIHSQIPESRHRRNKSITPDLVQTVPVDLSCGFAARKKAMSKSSRLFPDLLGCRPNTQNWQ